MLLIAGVLIRSICSYSLLVTLKLQKIVSGQIFIFLGKFVL